jgi:pimeloyl-ACP methyl ester carboxylesterase
MVRTSAIPGCIPNTCHRLFVIHPGIANVLREYHKIPNTGHRLFVIHAGIVNALTIKFLIQVTDYL